MPSFPALLTQLKDSEEDFEFYPTTKTILNKLGTILKQQKENGRYNSFRSFLDIGCGNGKVLDFVAGLDIFSKYYAIEKSQTHLSNLKPDYYILGVDFKNITLLDKEIDVIFCNPPYSEYDEWFIKIIKEAPKNSYVYLVVPERWSKSAQIESELKNRELKVNCKGKFDFENSEDRASRANIELLEIEIPGGYSEDGENDPFTQFFNENFSYPKPKEEFNFQERIDQTKLIHNKNLIETLCYLYDQRMAELRANYEAVCSLDPDLLKEFEITKNGLIASLKMKLSTTKKQYWQRLFEGMESIKKLLTHSSRQKILSLMQDQTGIDFNRDNCYAIVMWVIKNANKYFDKQLIETYEKMLNFANVENYKSNKNVFTEQHFRYSYYSYHKDKEPTHVKLKIGNRIVLHCCGGLSKGYFVAQSGLEERAAHFIGDLLVLANNLGFNPIEPAPLQNEWKDSSAKIYHCYYKGKQEVLFKVRAYLKGNMHFSFLPSFIHTLNLVHGRLKGWLTTHQEAEKEINAPKDLVDKFFEYRFQIDGENQLLLT